MTAKMLTELRYKEAILGVSYIFIIGVDDDIANDLAWDNDSELTGTNNGNYMRRVYNKSEIIGREIPEGRPAVNEFDRLIKIIKPEFLEKYEIDLSYNNDNIIAISHNLL